MTFVDDIEMVVDEVSTWAADIIQDIVSILSPDGRPFDMPKRTPEEQLLEYLPIRENPDAAFQYIASKSEEIIQNLSQGGVPPQLISSVHPFDIACSVVLAWSAGMETLIASGKYDVEKLNTTPPQPMTPPIQPNLETPEGYFPVSPPTSTPVSLM